MTELIISTRNFPPAGTQDIGIIYVVSCLSTDIVRDLKETIKNVMFGGALHSHALLKTCAALCRRSSSAPSEP